ncbi:transglycosylase family protein [Streptomyces sp. NPDC021224]|uniref:LysM peptidoglycan-binding domain-containing protein n=1 Tax=unclassified Streptomyces TaxID=2593676 RepID=UPI00379472C4
MLSANGRHRRPRQAPAAVVTVAATGAGLALPLLVAGAGAAQAADGGTWDKVAICESGGQWDATSDNGVFGGLSLTEDTWVRYGGLLYAPRPDLASRAHQIKVAEKVLDALGPDAFPGCELGTGLLDDPAGDDSGNGGGNGNGDGSTATPAPTTTADPTAPTAPADPGTPAATPTTPAAPTTPGTPATGTGTGTPAPPATASPTPTDPSAPAVTPTAPATDPSAPATSATPADPGTPTAGSGRHARPYSPTDEELAAADRASRTRTTAVVPGATDGDTGAGTADDGQANDQGNGGNSDTTSHKATDVYKIGAGDSLSGIAAAHDVPGGWQHLYDVNRQAIGDDPNLIKPGQTIDLG